MEIFLMIMFTLFILFIVGAFVLFAGAFICVMIDSYNYGRAKARE